MSNETSFENFLNQQNDEAWASALATLLRSIHEVDRNATQIWFAFYPLSLFCALEEAGDSLVRSATRLVKGELAEGQPVSRPAVSQHLRVLQAARLVTVRPQGNRRLYSIKRDGLDDLRKYLESFWSDVLTSYGAEIVRRITPKRRT